MNKVFRTLGRPEDAGSRLEVFNRAVGGRIQQEYDGTLQVGQDIDLDPGIFIDSTGNYFEVIGS